MKYYVVDAFAGEVFSGNPAGVCPVQNFPPDALMQRIAFENNLSETAFVVPRADGDFDLRWFTPKVEVPLCGHATLATAFVMATQEKPGTTELRFHTKSGLLTVTREADLFSMDFPALPAKQVAVTPLMAEAIGAPVREAHLATNLMLVADSAETVRGLAPDFAKVQAIPDCLGVIVTAKGDGQVDFVSRYFAPGAGVDEDPVTGSSHSTLVPYWAQRLGKTSLLAHQVSLRFGELHCALRGDRVSIAGRAALYLTGELHL